MSGGHNHYRNCTCPWCYHPSFAQPESTDAQPIDFHTATVGSFTDPNARCPVCDAPVFYYRSPYGGSVFFDELGPPWPKHPCTDNGRPPRKHDKAAPTTIQPAKDVPRWQKDEWQPIFIFWLGCEEGQDEREIHFRYCATWEFRFATIHKAPLEIQDLPALIKPTSDAAWAISTPKGTFSVTAREFKTERNPLLMRFRNRLAQMRKIQP